MAQQPTRGQQASAVLFSAAQTYLPHAATALRRLFPEARISTFGPEVGRIEGSSIHARELATVCRTAPVPFVRHLMNETVRLPPSAVDRAPMAAVEVTGDAHHDIALQVWTSGAAGVRAEAVRAEIDAALKRVSVTTARGQRSHILGVCMTPSGVSLGITRTSDALADWPGGRMILARRREQVSRAEWKLEELFKVFDVPLPSSSARALDLGASPGGWTRILRSRGYEVWAVDPGDLHPRVAADPAVHHVRTTAGRFLSAADKQGGQPFDLIVNDMRMVAERSCRVVLDAADRLVPGGIAIMTLKVTRQRATKTMERALRLLGRRYRPLFVRQLFHNKNEVTVVVQRM